MVSKFAKLSIVYIRKKFRAKNSEAKIILTKNNFFYVKKFFSSRSVRFFKLFFISTGEIIAGVKIQIFEFSKA